MKIFSKMFFLAIGLMLVAGCGGQDGADGSKKNGDKVENAVSEKVQLDFHIMSKCPFGVKVIQGITPVLEKMGDNIDLNVYYIGKEKDGVVTSMHGEPEVAGNKQQLCAHEIGDFGQWLSFLKCQNENWRKIPEGWEACAKTAKIDVAKFKECFEGEKGTELFKASAKISKDKKASGSPTIFLAGESYRGGRSADSFSRAICAKFKDAKPAYCAEIPASVKVPVTVVSDKRCQGRGCDPKRFLAFITHTFEGAEVKELDYSSPEGKELFKKTGQKFLPVAIFGANVKKEEAGYKRLQRRLAEIKGTDELVYPLGRDWDPTAEICDDAKDNTGNGLVDCADETCKTTKVCREEIKNQISVFVMSQCPYGVRAVDAMKAVLDNFGKDSSKINFTINFIGRIADGELNSMHGEKEVNEDLRQICAQKHYPKNYKFMDYVACRNDAWNKNHGKEDDKAWEECATNGIAAATIRKCSEGDEGKELLTASFELAQNLGISGSPNWLLNNKFEMQGRSADQIKTAFCEKNEVAGCENKLEAASPGKPVPAGSCGGGAVAKPSAKPAVKPEPVAKPVPADKK